jgi:chemotaxis methyl-accepting protein methylase
VEFSLYKTATIYRRITRRMVLKKQEALEDYAAFLRGNAKELDALFSDLLISVTSFFRNPDAFDVLKQKVFRKLLQRRGDEPLRVWVPGCSTGQEAYSIAMSFAESAEKASRARTLQVFATDLNDALLDKARHGLYAKSLGQDVSPERLRRFFVEEDGGYRSSNLCALVVFARQNLLKDPPFSRLDLISCRNLLIYLDPGVQKKVFPTFHYALKPGRFLFLGTSEAIGGFSDLFEPVDKKRKSIPGRRRRFRCFACRSKVRAVNKPHAATPDWSDLRFQRGRTPEKHRTVPTASSMPNARPTGSRSINSLHPACSSMPTCRFSSSGGQPTRISGRRPPAKRASTCCGWREKG